MLTPPLPVFAIYHKDCPDGLAAAATLLKRCSAVPGHERPPITFFAVEPGFTTLPSDLVLPDPAWSLVYFLDVSPSLEMLRALEDKNTSVTIIDHHKTAIERFPTDVQRTFSRVGFRLSSEQSAAMLTWRFLFPQQAIPALINLVNDCDLWLHQFHGSKDAYRYLASLPDDPAVWHQMLGASSQMLIEAGRNISQAHDKHVRLLLEEARTAVIQGIMVPAVNAPHWYASDVANALLSRFPNAHFSAVYSDAGDGTRRWSLRSDERRLDVSVIAARYDGGGHRNSAGFRETPGHRRVSLLDIPFAEPTTA